MNTSRGARSAALLVLAMQLALSPFLVTQAHAIGGNLTVLNGSDPRPFYIIAHNPNTIAEVDAALQVGGADADPLANALEPDVTVAEDCNGADILVAWDSSAPNRGGHCDDVHLDDWMQAVHQRAIDHPELAMIMFDIKSSAATVDRVEEVLNDIHTILNTGPVGLNIILNVGYLSDAPAFETAKMEKLGPREGVNVDAEDDVRSSWTSSSSTKSMPHIGWRWDELPGALPFPARSTKPPSAGRARVSRGDQRRLHAESRHQHALLHLRRRGRIIPDAFGIESGDPAYLHQLANVVISTRNPPGDPRRQSVEPAFSVYGPKSRRAAGRSPNGRQSGRSR